MAILRPDQLTELRQECSKVMRVNYLKADVNKALQAIEDWFEANRVAISKAIDSATSPVIFTVPQKKQIAKHWLKNKFGRE